MSRRDYYNDPDAPKANALVPAVSGVVLDDERILLIQRSDNGKWALPGGGIEIGESVRDALVREVREETGIEVEVTGIVGVYSDPAHVIAYDDGEVRQQFSICLAARPTGGTLRNSSESTSVRWVPLSEWERLDMHPAQQLRIRDGLDPEAPPRIA